MGKENSVLIVSWKKGQDPLADPPVSITWGDGSPGTIHDLERHVKDTFSWDLECPDGPQRIIRPSTIANARFDLIAGAWVIGGQGVPRTVLDITNPNATDREIALEMSDWQTVYRIRVYRSKNLAADGKDARAHRGRTSNSLYWIASVQKKHDWLIFASTMRSAAAFHRGTFGCAIDSRLCHRVLERVRPCPFYSGNGEAPCYAVDDDLIQLGFRVLSVPGIQAAKLGHETYVMGYQFNAISELRDDMSEASTGTRPCGTTRYPPQLEF